jgi:WD40 repeat protein
LPPRAINALLYTADGEGLITLQKGGLIQFWNSQTGELLYKIEGAKDVEQYSRNIKISDNGGVLVYYGPLLKSSAWSTQTKQKLAELGEVTGLTFSPKGDLLLTYNSKGFSLWGIKIITPK